ncbi:MAG TPA: hypothetical protein VJ837_00795, partial [Candidatus Paceibacterota bacterium]|nr:hypothetical protein [Candidatus Paceibacterota bacterium]
MEDEDEIDFKEAGDEHRSSIRPDDRSRRPDLQRRPVAAAVKPMPGRDKQAEPQLEIEDVVEQLAEIADESVIAPPPTDEELEGGLPSVSTLDDGIEEAEVGAIEEAEVGAIDELPGTEDLEQVEETPDLGKPRRGRRKSADKDKEDAGPARGGKRADKAETTDSARRKPKPRRKTSRRRSEETFDDAAPIITAAQESASQFERVTDEDLQQDAGELLKDAILQEKFIDEVHSAEYQTTSAPLEPEPEWRVGTFRPQFDKEDATFQRVVDETAESVPAQDSTPRQAEQPSEDLDVPFSQPGEDRPVSPFRHIADFLPRGLFRRTQADVADERNEADFLPRRMDQPGESEGETDTETNGDSEVNLRDAEASVRDRGDRSEF